MRIYGNDETLTIHQTTGKSSRGQLIILGSIAFGLGLIFTIVVVRQSTGTDSSGSSGGAVIPVGAAAFLVAIGGLFMFGGSLAVLTAWRGNIPELIYYFSADSIIVAHRFKDGHTEREEFVPDQFSEIEVRIRNLVETAYSGEGSSLRIVEKDGQHLFFRAEEGVGHVGEMAAQISERTGIPVVHL